jgi:hypothetical protein
MPAQQKTTSKAASNGHRVIDLDVARAARAETAGQPVVLKINGQQIALPSEVPADFALFSADGRLREAVEALFGDQAEAFFGAKPSIDDLNELIDQITSVYGIDQGE